MTPAESSGLVHRNHSQHLIHPGDLISAIEALEAQRQTTFPFYSGTEEPPQRQLEPEDVRHMMGRVNPAAISGHID